MCVCVCVCVRVHVCVCVCACACVCVCEISLMFSKHHISFLARIRKGTSNGLYWFCCLLQVLCSWTGLLLPTCGYNAGKSAMAYPREDPLPSARSRRAVLLLQRQHDYPLNCVMNMDQTMLRFDMLPQRTNDKKGCRQVRTKTTRAEKRGFTVALFLAADGAKFPSMIVFKERNGQIPPRVYQQLQVPDNV